jgi:hypothetical protein
LLGDAHRAGLRHTTAVVAAQVEELGVLGAFLLVGQQFLFQRQIFLVGGAALAGAGNRPHGDVLVFEAHQDLGGRAHHLEFLEVEIEHVGRGIEAADRPVQGQRAGAEGLAHALAEHHLHDVALDDVILGLLHGSLEGFLAEARNRLGRRGAVLGRHVDRLAQLADQLLQAPHGTRVGVGDFRLGIHHQGELARQVVDDGDFFGQQQQDVRRVQFVLLLGLGQARLDVAHRVVAEAAHQAAGKARQVVARRHLDAVHELGDVVERIAIVAAFDQAVVGQQQHRAAMHFDARGGGQADDRVAAETLAALHGFEQVGVGRVGQLQVNGKRGVEIRKGFERNRNAVIALVGQGVEFCFGHGDSGRT